MKRESGWGCVTLRSLVAPHLPASELSASGRGDYEELRSLCTADSKEVPTPSHCLGLYDRV